MLLRPEARHGVLEGCQPRKNKSYLLSKHITQYRKSYHHTCLISVHHIFSELGLSCSKQGKGSDIKTSAITSLENKVLEHLMRITVPYIFLLRLGDLQQFFQDSHNITTFSKLCSQIFTFVYTEIEKHKVVMEYQNHQRELIKSWLDHNRMINIKQHTADFFIKPTLTRVNCPRSLLSDAISRSPWCTLISTCV